MSLADELNKLEGLHQRGALSDDEFARAKARLMEQHGDAAQPVLKAVNRLRRSATDRWLGGVCGGLARVTGLESWVWRLVLTVLVCFGGAGLLVYLLLWIFVPRD